MALLLEAGLSDKDALLRYELFSRECIAALGKQDSMSGQEAFDWLDSIDKSDLLAWNV